MTKGKNAKSTPNRKEVSEAREMQYGKDFKFYEVFARIWGWDGYETEPQRAVKQLCGYMKAEEKKANPKRERPQDPELQFYVGVAYLSGWIPCNNHEKKAAMWFARSDLQGCDKGALGLGYIMEKGLAECESMDDYKAMVEYYTTAAKQGNVFAQYRLANILYQIDPDNPRLIQLLLNAADTGYRPAQDLFDRVCSRRRKIPAQEEHQADSFTQKQDLNYDEIKDLLLKLLKNSEDTLAIVRRVEVALQMLQSSLNSMWTELREADAENSDKLDILQQQMNETLQKAVSVEFAPVTHKAIEDAEAFMSVLFKDDWRKPGRLCNASCDALVTAYVLMKVADMLEIRNYSGIVITAVWALEHECRRRFRDSFEKYLASINVPEEERASRMNLKPDTDGNIAFTLGSTYYVVNPSKLKNVWQFTKPSEFDSFAKACDFLSTAAKEVQKRRHYPDAGMVFWDYWIPGTEKSEKKNTKVTGQSFTQILYTLNKNYRIPAAHAMEVGRKEAEVCCDLLGITEAHKEMNNITGALKVLLWLTAPLE